MQIKEFNGHKLVSCKELQETLHKALLDLDELMEELKVLNIPESKRRERTSNFRDVMGCIFKLNGLDYEIYRMTDIKGMSISSSAVMVNDDLKNGLKEAVDVMLRVDEFLAEYR